MGCKTLVGCIKYDVLVFLNDRHYQAVFPFLLSMILMSFMVEQYHLMATQESLIGTYIIYRKLAEN